MPRSAEPGDGPPQSALNAESLRPSAPVEQILTGWLVEAGLRGSPIPGLIDGYCERLLALGLPLARLSTGYYLIHPHHGGHNFRWTIETGQTTQETFERAAVRDEAFRNSPFFQIQRQEGRFQRWRLGDREESLEYPLLEQLREQGYTDYCLFFHSYGRQADLRFWPDRPAGVRVFEGVPLALATRRSSGFTDAEVALLAATGPALALVMKAEATEQLSSALLHTYIGSYSAERVLRGQTTRGDVDQLDCAIWYADLRGSTTLAETMPIDAYLALLNEYFECTAGSVVAHGGEVLKFIGDAVMAIFPIDGTLRRPAAMAQSALAAAREALVQADRRNAVRAAAGEPRIELGIALHVGEVAYGNVGLSRRLDFTVIGPAANTVTRLEELCKTLDLRLVASRAFAALAGETLASAGTFRLRGGSEDHEVFSLP